MIFIKVKWIPWLLIIGGIISICSGEGNAWTGLILVVGIILAVIQVNNKNKNTITQNKTPIPPSTPYTGNAPIQPSTPYTGNAPIPPSTPYTGNAPIPPSYPYTGNAPIPPSYSYTGNPPIQPGTPYSGNTPIQKSTPTSDYITIQKSPVNQNGIYAQSTVSGNANTLNYNSQAGNYTQNINTASTTTKKCPSCGNIESNEMVFCSKCGTLLQ